MVGLFATKSLRPKPRGLCLSPTFTDPSRRAPRDMGEYPVILNLSRHYAHRPLRLGGSCCVACPGTHGEQGDPVFCAATAFANLTATLFVSTARE